MSIATGSVSPAYRAPLRFAKTHSHDDGCHHCHDHAHNHKHERSSSPTQLSTTAAPSSRPEALSQSGASMTHSANEPLENPFYFLKTFVRNLIHRSPERFEPQTSRTFLQTLRDILNDTVAWVREMCRIISHDVRQLFLDSSLSKHHHDHDHEHCHHPPDQAHNHGHAHQAERLHSPSHRQSSSGQDEPAPKPEEKTHRHSHHHSHPEHDAHKH